MSNIDIYFTLSGGVNNTDVQASLGGPASFALGGVVVSQNVIFASGGVPGVTFVGADGVTPGLVSIDWNNTLGTLTWTDTLAATHTVYAGGPEGLYQSSTGAGRVVFYVVPSLSAAGPKSAGYQVMAAKENVLDNVGFTERANSHTNFRALYLRNNTAFDIGSLSIEVVKQPTYGTVELGSEFLGSFDSAVSAGYVERNHLTMFGETQYGASPVLGVQDLANYYYHGPFMNSPSPATILVQDSDGVSTNLASVLADEFDSTDVLGQVNFQNALEWLSLPANKFVSFWVKRTIPAGASGSAYFADDFKIRAFYAGD